MEVIYRSFVTLVADPSLWLVMVAAVPMGMIFGAVPGLGGKLGIVLSIPFVFGMDMVPGCVFLVAMHSVVHTGGSIPSILLGIPGTGPDAATVCDGHPMARRGEGGRALGASLAASAVGGVFGAVFLAALMPIVQPTVLAFGPAESFFLALLGITFIGAVSGDDVVKGVLVGALGLMLSFVGAEQQTGMPRFSMGQIFLWDGIDVITAVPRNLRGTGVPGARRQSHDVECSLRRGRYRLSELLDGVADVGRHWGLTLRTSFIGAVIGLIPGLGGDVASWMCYAHAVQTSRTPERFGKGAVEGVIGPEAANNSKEGGALLPTLFFGIPGSSGMVLMLGAFIVLGVQPGPSMAREHLDLVWILIWTLVIANLLARDHVFPRGTMAGARGARARGTSRALHPAPHMPGRLSWRRQLGEPPSARGARRARMRVQALRLAARPVRHRHHPRPDHGAIPASVTGHLGGGLRFPSRGVLTRDRHTDHRRRIAA